MYFESIPSGLFIMIIAFLANIKKNCRFLGHSFFTLSLAYEALQVAFREWVFIRYRNTEKSQKHSSSF